MMQQIKNIIFHRYTVLIIAGGMIWTGSSLYKSSFVALDHDSLREQVESAIVDLDAELGSSMNQLERILNENKSETIFERSELLLKSLGNEDNKSLFVFKNGIAEFWTTAHSLPDSLQLASMSNKGVLKLRNGWYRYFRKQVDEERTIVGLYLLRHDYLNRNKFLSDAFHPAFGIPETAMLMDEPSDDLISIQSGEGDFLFGIMLNENDARSDSALYFIAVLLLGGMVLLVRFLKEECINLERFVGSFYASILLVFSVGLLRYWSLVMEFPSALYEFELFKPDLFAASFFLPSLGDFLINALLILYVFYFLDARSRAFSYRLAGNQTLATVLSGAMVLLILVYGFIIGVLLKGLIEDSNIEFNINNIFNLSLYSFVGFIIIGLLFFAFYLFCEFAFRTSVSMQTKPRNMFLVVALLAIIDLVIQHIIGQRDLLLILWPVFVLGVLFYVHYYSKTKTVSFNVTVLLLLTFSGFTAHALSKFTSAKEGQNRIVLAEKLATDEDPIVEILYSEMETDLLRSNVLNNAFDSTRNFSKTQFEEELEKKYFSGDWNNFDIQYYLFSSDSTPLGLEGFAPVREFSELDNIILENGVPSKFSGNMNFIYNSVNKLSYVIKLPVSLRNESPKGFLFCELRSKKIPEDIGFPELLMDKGSNKIDVIHQYSYARYVDSVQVNRFGSYRYSLLSSHYPALKSKYEFRKENNYDHLFYQVDDRTMLILSRPEERFINQATSFSYLFTLFCLIVITGFSLKQLSRGITAIHLSLQGKVQFLLVGVLLISLVLFGLGTRYFIADQYQEKNHNIISEKIQSVRIEVTHKLGREQELGKELKNYVGYILDKFSSVFLSDINLYDKDGSLIASSRPKIFQSGLLSSQMNPEAFHQMTHEKNSEFIQDEVIGNMHYLSAYVPLLNDHNELLGYLNLPYFAKQSALETELSSFLVAILNIFVVLFALSILAALFVSNWITKPLRLVQQSLANIQLGKTNKPIAYKGKDEIGSLVEEYNKKVSELEHYAVELAKSERESAWREMAKQVAHEIKNPLTPMRLSIQHMQRSLRPEDPDWNEKLNRFTHTVIEQIDALSNIATEFSNFAKMPKAQEELIDLCTVLNNAVELYKDTPDVQVKIARMDLQQAIIYADKDQMVRVFNNLIKNAIQAIPENKMGKVDVYLKKNEDRFVVEIRDNGTGIAPEKIDKIFTPNFTTKSTGMGLGLAMVKNIVENANGKIWFETSWGTGTGFFVALPVHSA